MPLNLSHKEVRELAKNLRDLTGREVKHTDIIAAIAKSVGRRADAMMHELKNEGSPASDLSARAKRTPVERVIAAGFSKGEGGYTLALLERLVDPVESLSVRILPMEGRTEVDDLWNVQLLLVTGRAGRPFTAVVKDVGKGFDGGLSMPEALTTAFEFASVRYSSWERWSSEESVQRDFTDTNELARNEILERYGDLCDAARKREKGMTPEDSKRIAKQAGFEIWDTGGGCEAFAKMLREEDTPGGDKVSMELMITVEGGTSIDAAPHERVWGAGINFNDPLGGDSPLSTETDNLTLEEAIAAALKFEKQADQIWAENYDPDAIAEYEGKHGM